MEINWKRFFKRLPFSILLGWFVGTFPFIVLDEFGYSLHFVASGSMTPELKVGCPMLMKKIKNATEELDVGDVAIHLEIHGEIIGVNHRITGTCEDGWVSKGDANRISDGCVPYKRFTHKMIWKGC